MSHLSFMERLLEGIEVEWKPLGEIGDIRMCKRILKEQTLSEGEIPFYKIGTFGKIPDAYISRRLFEEFKAKYNYPKVGEVLISASGTIGRTVIFDGKDAYFQDSNIVWVENNESRVLNKYLFYYYQIAKWGVAEGGTIQRLYNENLRKLQIPVPPLDIQAEIVRILDAFTALTAELTAELTARKKQYNYYRDQLLTFEEGEVEWKTLGEMVIFRRGTSITKKQTTNGEIPVVANGPLPTYFHREKNREGETIVIARSGAYAGYVSFWNQPIFLTDAFSVHPTSTVLKPKFVYYFLQNKQDYIHTMKKGAGVPHVRVKEFESFDVPIPSLTEQERIVAILDKFDALTNSITEGLPREIALRQKQYEYYCDLLLSFPTVEVEAALRIGQG